VSELLDLWCHTCVVDVAAVRGCGTRDAAATPIRTRQAQVGYPVPHERIQETVAQETVVSRTRVQYAWGLRVSSVLDMVRVARTTWIG
jgi:hypothetical protein